MKKSILLFRRNTSKSTFQKSGGLPSPVHRGLLPDVLIHRLAVLAVHLDDGLLHLAVSDKAAQSRGNLPLGHARALADGVGVHRLGRVHHELDDTLTGSGGFQAGLGGLIALAPLGVGGVQLGNLVQGVLRQLGRQALSVGNGSQKLTLSHWFYLSPFFGLRLSF